MTEDVFNEYLKSPMEAFNNSETIELLAERFSNPKKFSSSLFSKMWLNHLETFESLCPNVLRNTEFTIAKLAQKYEFANQETEELYYLLNNFYQDAKSSKFEGLISVALINLLTVGPKLGVYDEELLLEYFNYHRPHPFYITPGVPNKEFESFKSFLITSPNELDLVTEYFDNIFPIKTDFTEYLPFISSENLEKHLARAQLLSENHSSDCSKNLPMSLLKELESSNILLPVEYNPKLFSKDELVSIKVKLKNIKTLFVKIIEINTKAYFLQNNSQVPYDVNLDGLIVEEEYSYDYDFNKFQTFIRTFEFSSLTGKQGTFVIEFIGNGLTTRAIIKKGFLRYIQKTTAAGYMIHIFDENNLLCTTGGVFLDGKFFALNEKNYALVPFSQQKTTKNIILTDGVIYEFVSGFDHDVENFEFQCDFLAYDEQFVFGKNAEVFIYPKLFINSVQTNISLLSTLEATITTFDIDNLTSSKVFNDLRVSTDKIVLEINVPARISQILITVSAKLKIRDEIKDLSQKHVISINSLLKTQNLYQVYLNCEKNGYVLSFLGRNGEPWPNVETEFVFYFKHFLKENTCKLVSDENGKILLGKLKGISSFLCRNSDFQRKYHLDPFKPKINYSDQITICENDRLDLPVYIKHKEKLISYFAMLVQKGSKGYSKDQTSKLNYNKETGLLSLSNLEKGNYSLFLFKPNKTIEITVVDGIH